MKKNETNKKQKSFADLQSELQEVLAHLQSGDVDIDEAFTQYEKGEKLIAELEKSLKQAKNKLKKLDS